MLRTREIEGYSGSSSQTGVKHEQRDAVTLHAYEPPVVTDHGSIADHTFNRPPGICEGNGGTCADGRVREAVRARAFRRGFSLAECKWESYGDRFRSGGGRRTHCVFVRHPCGQIAPANCLISSSENRPSRSSSVGGFTSRPVRQRLQRGSSPRARAPRTFRADRSNGQPQSAQTTRRASSTTAATVLARARACGGRSPGDHAHSYGTRRARARFSGRSCRDGPAAMPRPVSR